MVSVGRIAGVLLLAPFILAAGPADKRDPSTAFIDEVMKSPKTPAPPAPAAPVYRGTVEPITDPVVIKLRPLSERVIVTVTSAGPDKPREVTRVLLTVERRGNDLLHTRRTMPAATGEKTAESWRAIRLVTDESGRIKDLSADLPPLSPDTPPFLIPVIKELFPRIARAAADSAQPTFPERGVRTGDVVNAAQADDSWLQFRTRMVVRGLSTFEGKRVLVVDQNDMMSTQGKGTSSKGYALIDLNTGFMIYSDSTVVTASKRSNKVETEQYRAIQRMPDPGAVAPAAAAR
jgi:hypothetical protein